VRLEGRLCEVLTWIRGALTTGVLSPSRDTCRKDYVTLRWVLITACCDLVGRRVLGGKGRRRWSSAADRVTPSDRSNTAAIRNSVFCNSKAFIVQCKTVERTSVQ